MSDGSVRVKSGLRSALLRSIIPVVVLGLVATGLWSVTSTWYGARMGTEAWLRETSRSVPYLLAAVRDHAISRLGELSHGSATPGDGETLLQLTPSGALLPSSGELPDPALVELLPALGPGTHASLVASRQRLYCIATTSMTPLGRTVVVSDVTNEVADRFAELLGAEVVHYLDGQAVASTWRNRDGQRVLEAPDEALAAAVRSPSSIEVGVMEEGTYEAGGYAGYAKAPGELYRGEDLVPVFRALYPLRDQTDGDLGVLAGMIPMDVLMRGPRQGMYGATFFVLLTALVSILVLLRVSGRQLAPLVALTQRVRALRMTIGERLPKLDAVEPLPGRTQHEIDDLARAFTELEVVANEATRLEADLAASRDRLAKQASELERAHRAALESSRLKSEFLANMSHEIRTPMNGVIGMASVLSGTPLDASQREYIAAIQRSGEDLISVINDILDFSKVEAGKLSLTCYRFHVRECVDDVLQLLGKRASERGLELACTIDDQVPAWVEGDPVRLRQVLVNLVGNAIKFTEHGEVTISVSPGPTPDIVQWSVTDTGVGIPETAQQALFDPFIQVDGSLSRPHSGTGLGLAICRQLVQLMGGTIGVESEVGVGSRFFFSTHLEPAPEGGAALPRHLLVSKRVLIVDDRKTNRTIVRQQLQRLGMDVEEAADGEAGLRALDQASAAGRPFDLAIVDVNMRPLDGIELRERIRRDPRFERLPLLISASTGESRIQGLDDSELDAVLIKPIRESTLYATVQRLLGHEHVEETEETLRTTPAPPARHGGRILVVEDQLINQKVAVAMLERIGLSVCVASSGEEALRILREGGRFDLVLMDCQMPGIDGFEASRRIRQGDGGQPDVIIVAMTAQAMKGDREACLTAGMNDYCPKPVTLEKLRDVIDQWLPQARSAPVDPDVLEQLGLGEDESAELRSEIRRVFLEETPEQVDAIRRAALRSDWTTLAATAHSMKSACQYLGAKGLADRCSSIETAAREHIEVGPAVIAAFDREWERVRLHVEGMTA